MRRETRYRQVAGHALAHEASTDEHSVEPAAFMPVPAKSTLTVGHADDPAEHAADRLAESALGRVRREPADLGTLTARAPAPAPPTGRPLIGRAGGVLDTGTDGAIQRMRGGGAPLPEQVRGRLESAFGSDLGSVRVHADDRAAQLSQSLSAKAFTVGSDMFFGAGQFRPDTPAGEHTLAHEVAHVVQGGGTARRVQRKFDLQEQQPLGLENTRSIGTVGTRQVWFVTSADDTVVVKLEDQPLGLNQLATHLHTNLTKVSTVTTKKLLPTDKADVRSMIEAGRLTAGDGWAKAQSGDISKDTYGGDLAAYGRAVHLAAIDSKPDAPMIAMTVASGETMGKLQDPSLSYEKDGEAPIQKVLTDAKMLRQLGELSAVDLFIGNRDRMLSGNLGNWFYTPEREMTVIDNVDATMTKYLTGVGEEPKAADPLDMLAKGALPQTARDLVQAVVNVVKNDDRMQKTMTYKSGSGTYKAADKEKQAQWMSWVEQRRAVMEKEVLAGLVAGRKRIIATMTAGRFASSGKRATKKSIKAEAALATQRDADHSQTDYYEKLKRRAKWLAKH